MLATVHTCRGQRIAFRSGFRFHPGVPGKQTQVIGFVSKAPGLLTEHVSLQAKN